MLDNCSAWHVSVANGQVGIHGNSCRLLLLITTLLSSGTRMPLSLDSDWESGGILNKIVKRGGHRPVAVVLRKVSPRGWTTEGATDIWLLF